MTKKRTSLYIGTVILSAIAILVALWPYHALAAADGKQLAGATILVVIAFLSEALAFYFGSGAQLSASVSFLPFFACMVLFPPAIAVPAIALAVAASNIYPHPRPLKSAAFNISQAVISAAAASVLYHRIAPTDINLISVSGIGTFAVLAIVFFTVNMTLVAGALAGIREQRYIIVLADVMGQKGGNLVYGVLASPIALFIALLYSKYSVAGIVLTLLPLLLVRYALADKVALQKANKDLLKVLIKAIETRDPYTSGHSLRVATLAVAIAEDLRLSRRAIDEVEIAALLHDVGKIDPSFSAVIRKPYDLTADERALIQTHAALGADLLRNLKSVPQPIVDAVRHHHERMDGGGYPDGLMGDSIPLPARIIMLCDSIDAMLSDRPYRKALSLDRVRQELIRCSGDQFDAEIVRVVLQKDTLTKATQLIDTVSGFEDEYLIRAHG
jgi:putative nucleotidyltransferase with HDIG domain